MAVEIINDKQDKQELPSGWVECELGEVFLIERGGSPRPIESYITKNEDGINWIKIGDTKNSPKYIFSTKQKIKPEGMKKSRFVKEGDFILSNSMSFGKPYIMKTTGCIHDGWVVFRNTYQMASEEYLYYVLSSQEIYIKFARVATGSTVKNLNIDRIKQITVKFPPLNEQNRIVEKIEELFTELDKGVQYLNDLKIQLRKYRQSVLKHAFNGELTKEWREANKDQLEPASVLLRKIKEERKAKLGSKYKEFPPVDKSNLPELPEGWEWVTTSDICESVRDGTHDTPKYVESGVPLVTSKNLKHFGIDFSLSKNISIKDHEQISIRSGVDNGDILFAMIGTIGNPVIINTNIKFSIKNVALFKKNEDYILPKYLKHWLSSQSLNNIINLKQLLKGTTQKFIPLEHLRILPVPYCSILEQQKTIEEIEKHLSVADKTEQIINDSLKQADRLRQSILKQAFEGKLVPQDPTDEPASELLKRIKAEKEKQKRKK